MAADCDLYDTGLIAKLADLIDLGDFEDSSTTAIISCKIQNDGDSLATVVKVAARCLNGLYSGQDDSIGNEIIVNQYIEAQVGGGGYQAIGGDFSITDSAGNWLAISDIAAGAASSQVDFRLVLPAGISSAGNVLFQILVSFKP